MKIDVVELQLKTKYQIELDSTDGYVYGIETAKEIFFHEIGCCDVEKVGAIFTNSINKIVNYSNIAMGGINSVTLPIAELFKVALLSNASKMIIAHNHPSGVLEITLSDIELTRKIGQTAKLFDMFLIDSLIINKDGNIKSIREHIKEMN